MKVRLKENTKNKRFSKIIALFMLIITLLGSFQGIVNASTPISNAHLHEVQATEYHLQFWDTKQNAWSYIICNYVGYDYNGKVYPAYCVNRELGGVYQYGAYDVSVDSAISRDDVWRVIINGFPYKSPSELGVENDLDAYVATKQAVYCMLYNIDANSYYRGGDTRGTKIKNAIVNLANIGRNGSQSRRQANVSSSKVGEFTKQGNNYYQEYQVNSEVSISSYSIGNIANMPKGAYIADTNGNRKTNFNSNEHFRLYVPESSLSQDLNVAISIQTKCKTYPVLYGKAPNSDYQNYALTFDPLTDESAIAKLELKTNNASIVINKSEKDTGAKIKGVDFTLLRDGKEIQRKTTDENGKVTFTGLYQGTYQVLESKVPYGYLIINEANEVIAKFNENSNINIVNTEPKGEIKVQKQDNYNNKLKGAEISLYAKEDIKNTAKTKTWYKKGSFVAKAITNDNGEVVFNNLHLGHYYVKETKAPEGYLLNNKEYDANLVYKDNQTETIYLNTENIKNEEPTGTISIIKKDVETGSTTQGDAKFTGAVYKIFAKEDIYNKAKTKKFYSKGDLVATRTMNEKGNTEDVTGLPLGKYMVKEDTAPEGYMIDTEEHEVNLVYKDQYTKVISNTTTSKEKVMKMGVHIFKSGIKENSGVTPGLVGAEFTIKLNSQVENAYSQGFTYAEVWNGIDEEGNKVKVDSSRVQKAQAIAPSYAVITTDENGNAYTEKNLPYGKYIGKETKTPVDYDTAADFTFSITTDETLVKNIAQKSKHIVINNEQTESYVKLVKKDLKTGKNVTLNSTTFEIKATKDIYDRATKKILFKKGEAISQKIGNTTYTSFTTNADNIVVPAKSFNSKNDKKSEVTTPLKLPVGSYEITELRVPEGFLQLDNSVKFDIKNIKDYDVDKDGDYIREVVIKNEQPTGTINLDKTIALRKDMDKSLVDTSDLSEIEFKLTAKEDIIDKADGSKIYTKGQEIKTYNLSKDGKLEISDLPMGTYELQETKTLDGLVLNNRKYEVKFEQKDLATKVYTEKLDISNDTTEVDFSKTDVTGDKELVGAKLQVIDKDNNVIDEWTSTDKTHKIEGLKVNEEYTLREEIAPEGYVIANEVKFKVNDTNETQKVQMKDKIVEISKEDISGKEIEGAKLQVLDKEGKIVDEWTSEKTPHKVTGLKEGEKYTLHEEVSVGNYVKATDIEFEVTTKKENQKITMIDKLVEITKTDLTTGEELEGAELEVTDENGNIVDKWTSTKEPHQVKGLEERKTYTLTEKTCPYGYEQAETITFKVTEDKETQKVVMKDMPILKNVKVIKIDSNTKEIIKDKFTFAIYEDPECTKLIKEIKSNKEDGFVEFNDLRYGTYYIKETKAPKDYELSNRVAKVEINDKGIFVDDSKVEEKDNTIEINFENKKIEVPKTGDNSYLRLALGIVILATLGIAYIFIHKHNKDKNNK